MKGNESVVPVNPGMLIRVFPGRDSDGWLVKGKTAFGRKIPFEINPVFQVASYILDKEGGHVTFERQQGTWYMRGFDFCDIKFPFPHPMFQVIGDDEAAQIRAEWAAFGLIERSIHPLRRIMSRLLPKSRKIALA